MIFIFVFTQENNCCFCKVLDLCSQLYDQFSLYY